MCSCEKGEQRLSFHAWEKVSECGLEALKKPNRLTNDWLQFHIHVCKQFTPSFFFFFTSEQYNPHCRLSKKKGSVEVFACGSDVKGKQRLSTFLSLWFVPFISFFLTRFTAVLWKSELIVNKSSACTQPVQPFKWALHQKRERERKHWDDMRGYFMSFDAPRVQFVHFDLKKNLKTTNQLLAYYAAVSSSDLGYVVLRGNSLCIVECFPRCHQSAADVRARWHILKLVELCGKRARL